MKQTSSTRGGAVEGSCCSEKLVQKLVGVQDAAKARNAAHEQPRDALGVR